MEHHNMSNLTVKQNIKENRIDRRLLKKQKMTENANTHLMLF